MKSKRKIIRHNKNKKKIFIGTSFGTLWATSIYISILFQVEWPEFASVLATLLKADDDEEENYKETFRVFSKDEQGCIPAEEMKFILSQICSTEVSYVTFQEIIQLLSWQSCNTFLVDQLFFMNVSLNNKLSCRRQMKSWQLWTEMGMVWLVILNSGVWWALIQSYCETSHE